MNSKCDFTKGTFSYQFHKFIVLEGSRRQLIVLLYVGLYKLYQTVSFLKNSFINLSCTFNVVIALTLVKLWNVILWNINVPTVASTSTWSSTVSLELFIAGLRVFSALGQLRGDNWISSVICVAVNVVVDLNGHWDIWGGSTVLWTRLLLTLGV